MASNRTPITVDPRIINPLICSPISPLGSFASDTLYDVAHCLGLFADLLGNAGPDSVFLQSRDHRFALLLQLQGVASVLEAVADALLQEKIDSDPSQLRIELSQEELGALRAVADMLNCTIEEVVRGAVASCSDTLGAAFGTHPSPKND